jgi:uncharacterized membrane protein YheB (UPF0754 family)
MNYWLYLIIPLISACIGWITIWIAIKMLFRPLKPTHFLGLRIQGVFPKQQQKLAENIGRTVSKQLLSFDNISDQISNSSNLEKIMPLIENHIDDFLRNRLATEIPMIGMFVGDKTIDILKKAFMKELSLLFPIIMKEYAANIKHELDLEKIVTRKIAELPPSLLETLVSRSMSREFKMVMVLGAITGLLIGVIQVLIFQLLG